jgi:hypothetical protein
MVDAGECRGKLFKRCFHLLSLHRKPLSEAGNTLPCWARYAKYLCLNLCDEGYTSGAR